ncbi:TPA: hypothetical protein R4057_002019 [Kluyvera ascorbata]|uniref:hypothetical protein n=1 Tax=Kluyvera ascorbata TaxID=51288 RepID=UPI0028969E25|nr:hypothetical protein [Kluyvera ascorbata]HED3065066.1 hypothetical protein [Kluyvera ascorbata]
MNNKQPLTVAMQVIIEKTRAAGGEPAVQALFDRLTASYSLIKNNGSEKKH